METKELEKVRDIKDMAIMFDKLPEDRRQRAVGIIQGLLLATEINQTFSRNKPKAG